MNKQTANVMSGGEAMMRAAVDLGCDTVFGIPGAQTYPLFDAMHRLGVRCITPRHEQSAAYMAMGYARSTGSTGVFSVVPGPGILNASAALCTAMGTCTPLVGLTGQVPSTFLGQGRGHLHELADQPGTLKTLIKDAMQITDPELAQTQTLAAFERARSGRPGPVTVEMCWDTMAQACEQQATLTASAPVPQPDEASLEAAVRLIKSARKPMIMCGGGAQHASVAVLALAERLNAPVTAFRSGRGVVAEDHPLGIGSVGARILWDDVDLLIGIGSRCEMPTMRWQSMMRYDAQLTGGRKLLRIDIDPTQMERLVPDVGLVTDAAHGCQLLLERLTGPLSPDSVRRSEIAAARKRAMNALESLTPHAGYLRIIRRHLPRDGIFVPELCQIGFTSYTDAFPVLAPRTYLTEGYQGTLGFGFPTALGAKIACPDRTVLSVCGDGGFMFGVQELATAAQYGIGLITLVFNNGAYGNVKRDQQTVFEGRVIGSDLPSPDLMKLAESFGVRGVRVTTPDELDRALPQWMANDQPVLVEVRCDLATETPPWRFIHMATCPV